MGPLRRIEKEFFLRGLHEYATQVEFAYGAREFACARLAATRVHCRKTVKAVGVATHQLGQVIVYADDGVPRGVPVGILDEFKRRVHHTSSDACCFNRSERLRACEIAIDCIEVCGRAEGAPVPTIGVDAEPMK